MKELNPLLHSQLRLAVISILMNVEEADFVYLKEKTECLASVPGRYAQLLTMEERLLKNM